MKPACPSCYRALPTDGVRLRCSSGKCTPEYHAEGTAEIGFERLVTPTWNRQIPQGQTALTPQSGYCMTCSEASSQEVCPFCYGDIPNEWRHGDIVKLTVAGARGAGKSVYITVLIETLRRFATAMGWSMGYATGSTKNVFEREYYEPTFGKNRLIQGTRGLDSADAYQRDPMVWRINKGGTNKPLYIVIRDVAGEELEGAAQPVKKFEYFERADLTVFLFDPMRLDNVVHLLNGVIPTVDEKRLGTTAQGVLPCLLAQMNEYSGLFAMVVAKFDAIQQLTVADNVHVNAIANPAAMFNRDNTFVSPAVFKRKNTENASKPAEGGTQVISTERFTYECELLDQEIRSLLGALNEQALTQQVENTLGYRRVPIRHFAVSSLGDTPEHENQLTVRGISPFRVLDPLLWVLMEKGAWR